jgi:hypothetical protein
MENILTYDSMGKEEKKIESLEKAELEILKKEIAEMKKGLTLTTTKIEKEAEYKIEKRPWTIKELKDMGAQFKEFFEIDGMKFPMNWDTMIHLCNSRIIQGRKITENMTLNQLFPVFTEVMSKNFF